jgi:hypothetical protein
MAYLVPCPASWAVNAALCHSAPATSAAELGRQWGSQCDIVSQGLSSWYVYVLFPVRSRFVLICSRFVLAPFPVHDLFSFSFRSRFVSPMPPSLSPWLWGSHHVYPDINKTKPHGQFPCEINRLAPISPFSKTPLAALAGDYIPRRNDFPFPWVPSGRSGGPVTKRALFN